MASGLCFHVGNFLGAGDEWLRSSRGQTRARIRVTLGGQRLEIHQRRRVIVGSREELRGWFVPSSRIMVVGTSKTDLHRARRLVDDVCSLLSIASMSRVVAYRVDDAAGNMLQGWSVVGTTGRSWTLIDIRNGARVREFLQQTYPVLRRMKGKRRFLACFDGLLHAEMGLLPEELRMVACYVSLEMFKDAWARDKNLPFVDGYFRHPPTRPGKRGRPYSFTDLVRAMCRDVRMTPALTRLTRYRNALIHSGGLRLSDRGKDRAYRFSQQLAREYVLRRLGYTGRYVVFGEMRFADLR